MTSNPTAPQPKVENWAYPFKAKGGQDVTDPWLYQQALAHARGGTYLLGSNGLWHGGVHFDEGTSAFLDQSRIHCIADGEVVAYRIDDKVHRFATEADSEGKTYSTSFVLIRHRLEAPQLPNGNETPPSLVFFSLYMHLLDWADYEAKPALPRPAFWGNDHYRVRTQGGKLNVRQEPRANAPVQAELANGSRIRIAGDGDWCQIIEILDNGLTLRPRRTQTSLGYVARRYLEPEAAPKAQNIVVVLDQPFPIKAGALLGHPGLYEGQQQIHLETFSCDDVPAFIEHSRAWSARLPESDKTLLKIHAGASKLITHRPDIDANHPPRISDPGVQVGVDLILSQGQLDALPAADKIMIAVRNEGGVRTSEQRWWHLKGLLADGEGKPIEGWLCEQEFITSRHSPWEWLNCLLLKDETAPEAMLAYLLDSRGALSEAERKKHASTIESAANDSIRTLLRKIIDINKDDKITNSEIRSALKSPWQSQAIYSLFAKHITEWKWNDEYWNSLDTLLGHSSSNPNWEWELQKLIIKSLCFWDEIKSLIISESIWSISSSFLIEAFNPSKDENSLRWLIVDKGQLTFDAEGNDNQNSIYFSRRAHWPPVGDSGVTIGRGYDIGQQPNVRDDLKNAGIEGEYLGWLAGAAGKRKNDAKIYLDNSEASKRQSHISRKQQYILFGYTYEFIEMDVARISKKKSVIEQYAPPSSDGDALWEGIDRKIKELMVDLRYRGDYTPKTRGKIQSLCYTNSFSELKKIIQDRNFWVSTIGVPLDRFKRRSDYVEKW